VWQQCVGQNAESRAMQIGRYLRNMLFAITCCYTTPNHSRNELQFKQITNPSANKYKPSRVRLSRNEVVCKFKVLLRLERKMHSALGSRRQMTRVRSKKPTDFHFVDDFIHSFVRSFLPSFIHSFLPSFIHSFLPSFIPPFLPSFIPSFIYSSLPSFIHSLIPSFIHSFIPSFLPSSLPSFIHSLIPSFIPSFIQSFIPPFLPSFIP